MTRHIPLSALRCFESAGRHLSFTLAADELSVTQSAVSRQIQNLEQWLGHKVFVRGHRSVTLTDAGRELLAVLTISFDEITGALDGIRSRPAGAPLAISVEPGFAACWLVPRLDRFRSQHAEIDVSIASDARLASFRHSDVQLAIRYSASVNHWPHVDAEPLVDVAMAPVAAPALLTSTRSPIRPADLRRLTLLHEENRDAWAQWFKRAGVKPMPMQRGPIFADLGIVLQAAIRGHGVALGDLFLLADEIRDGHLVQIFDIETPGGIFFLVAPNLETLSAEARTFADWLRSEIEPILPTGE